MARNGIATVCILFVFTIMFLHSSTMRTYQSTTSTKRSTQPILNWALWASKAQDFTENVGQILLPTPVPLDIDDTDTVRNFSLKLTKGTKNFTDELGDFLLSHRNVTNVWDVYLMRNLLDFYSGIFIYKYARLTQLWKDIAREVGDFVGFGREVHKYFFLEKGYRSHLKKFEARTKKFLKEMLTASPSNLALPCTYQRGIYLRLDQLMDSLGVPDPGMKINSTEYFNIRVAKMNDTCIALPKTFKLTRSMVQKTSRDRPQHKISAKRVTTPRDRSLRRHREVEDGSPVIPLELSENCLVFRFVSVSAEGRAPYIVQTLVEGVPHALHFSSLPPGDVALLQQTKAIGSARGRPDGLSPTPLLPIRLADGEEEVLLVHRLQSGERQFMAMEHTADGVVSWPADDTGLEADSFYTAPEDQMKTTNSKFMRKEQKDGGFYEAYGDAVEGIRKPAAIRHSKKQAVKSLFNSSIRSHEGELQPNALDEHVEMVHDDDGARQLLDNQKETGGETNFRGFYLGTSKLLVYDEEYHGEGAHWVLEKVV